MPTAGSDVRLDGHERYFQTSGLFGTPERCIEMIDQLKEIGMDEIACLIDYGIETESVLASLGKLNEVRCLANPEPVAA